MKVTGARHFLEKQPCRVIFSHIAEGRPPKIYTITEPLTRRFSSVRLLGETLRRENDALILYDLEGIEKVILFVLGDNTAPYKGEVTRKNAAHLLDLLKTVEAADIDLTMLSEIARDVGLEEDRFVSSLTEGLLLGGYGFTKYYTRKDIKEKKESRIKAVRLVSGRPVSAVIGKTAVVCNGTVTARDLVNEPGNVITPEALAERAVELSRRYGFAVTVFDREKIASLGMGGILGVNAGSEVPARLIITEHRHPEAKKTILLVGKGITFDSGGISLKQAKGMENMKSDMAGGAAVIAVVATAASLKLKANIIGIVPATDNKPGGSAQTPGDIITMYNGLTVEVVNTDAEGRLILADALSYGIERYRPDIAIDVATLTGACIIALGSQAAGLMTNTENLVPLMTEAGNETGERVWHLPLYEEYKEQLSSEVADLKNIGGHPAGPLTAGKFLEQFAGSTPWMHIDIAGTAFLETAAEYRPKGATGFGVRLLSAFVNIWLESGQ